MSNFDQKNVGQSNLDQHNLDETQPYIPPDTQFNQPEQPKNNRWLGGCLIGCLIVGVICLVICAGTGFFIVKQGPNIAIGFIRTVVVALLDESDLPEEEQEAILAQIDRVGDAFKSGDLSIQDFQLLMNDIVESPVMSVLFLQIVDSQFIESSGLSDEEKQAARESFQRLVAGVMSDQLTEEDLEPIMQQIRKHPDSDDPQKKQELKSEFTDDELRQLISDATELCDRKEIPPGETDIKISDKLKEIIDRRLP